MRRERKHEIKLENSFQSVLIKVGDRPVRENITPTNYSKTQIKSKYKWS